VDSYLAMAGDQARLLSPTEDTWMIMFLYRAYDAQGHLLYVGITGCVSQRFMDGHQHSAPWWMDLAALTVASYPDQESARAAEREAIKKEKPLWNIDGSPDAAAVRLNAWALALPKPSGVPPGDDELDRQAEARMLQWERINHLIREAERRALGISASTPEDLLRALSPEARARILAKAVASLASDQDEAAP
jgi:hypothetical protein